MRGTRKFWNKYHQNEGREKEIDLVTDLLYDVMKEIYMTKERLRFFE
mgnify:CR=1 FL=1